MLREAVISDDQKYRYTLYRDWSDEDEVDKLFYGVRVLNFVMLNPSTADGLKDDPTIRKCIGFARFNGFNAIRVVNLFAYRATNPKDIQKAYINCENIEGPQNDSYVQEIPPGEAVVAAWGSTFKDKGWMQERIQETIKLLNRRLWCLKKTKDGNPWHPLYVPYGPLIDSVDRPDNGQVGYARK